PTSDGESPRSTVGQPVARSALRRQSVPAAVDDRWFPIPCDRRYTRIASHRHACGRSPAASTLLAVSQGRPPPVPGSGRPAAAQTRTPPIGSKTAPPPIPERPRSLVRIEIEPDPRPVRSPLVGRADPLAILDDVVARAIDFQAPQLVTLVGNQGTGKTRLIKEVISEVQTSKDRPGRVFHGIAERDPSGKPVRLAALASLLRERSALPPDPAQAS